MRASTVWLIIAAIFFTISAISALGEWVFHWWEEPGDWLSVLSLLLGLLAIGVSASSGQVDRLATESAKEHRVLREGVERLNEGQERLLQGQERLLQGQERMLQGQAEQTSALRQVVDSFRGRVQE